jgi:hypothetical protein
MMKNCIIEWVGDLLIKIPFIKNQHEIDIAEGEITDIISNIKMDLIKLYRYKNIPDENRLLINIQENLNDLTDIKIFDQYPSSEQYYEWIVAENLNDCQFIYKMFCLYDTIEKLELWDTCNSVRKNLNDALMVIYDKINHQQPLTAWELLEIKNRNLK